MHAAKTFTRESNRNYERLFGTGKQLVLKVMKMGHVFGKIIFLTEDNKKKETSI